MVETYQSSKHDKMISLIAWLIVGSLLFYLAVYTFESFLRKSPYQEIIQQVGVQKSGGKKIELDSATTILTQPTDKLMQSEQLEKNIQSLPFIQELAGVEKPVIDKKMVSLPAAQTASPVSLLVPKVPVVSTDTKVVREVAVTQIDLPLVDAIAVSDPSLMVAAENNFSDIEAVFRFMKQVDYGEEDIRADIVETKDGFMVFFISPAAELSSASHLEHYLKMRNHGLKLSLRQAPDRAMPLSHTEPKQQETAANTPVSSQEPPTALSNTELQTNFQYNAQFKPFTIQIGAFNSHERAKTLVSEMSKRGYNSIFIEEKMLSGVANFRVLLGNFSSQREASIYATSLSEKENVPVYARSFL